MQVLGELSETKQNHDLTFGILKHWRSGNIFLYPMRSGRALHFFHTRTENKFLTYQKDIITASEADAEG